jgi:hypothetical protein
LSERNSGVFCSRRWRGDKVGDFRKPRITAAPGEAGGRLLVNYARYFSAVQQDQAHSRIGANF